MSGGTSQHTDRTPRSAETYGREKLLERTLEVAARLGRRAKAAIAGVKRTAYLGGSLPLPAGLRFERAEFLAALGFPEGELPGHLPGRVERSLEEGRFS